MTRRVLFWCHLSAGVTAGLVILLMSATGVLLAFQPQILALVDGPIRRVAAPADGRPRIDITTILASAASAKPGVEPTGVVLDVDREAAAAVMFGRDTVYVDPYTGQVLGQGSTAARAVFQKLTDWHRWLGVSAGSAWRANARMITGASNLLFLCLAASGLYLWMPRSWNWKWVRTMTRFDLRASGTARDFNWHHVIGFWCAPVLIVLTATAMVLSYPWANDLLYRAMGSRPPSATAPARTPEPARGEAGNLNLLWAGAEEAVPTWGTISLRLAPRPGGPMAFTITDANHWNTFARSQLTLDGSTGAVTRWEPYEATSLGQKARGWVRYAHTGELGGWPGQILAGTACLGGVFLVWTGLALAFRRFMAWRDAKTLLVRDRAA